jgi:hypothetical protein
MPRKKREEIEQAGTLEESKYSVLAVKTMHECLSLNEFTAQDFHEIALREGIPSEFIARYSGSLFKRYQAAFFIRKTKRFKLSERTSAPLPVWITARKLREIR